MIETGLIGKVVVVTGGAAGIGLATARRFAEENCRISVWDRNAPPPDLAADFQQTDVSETASVAAATAAVLALWGRIDILINNAGILRDAQLARVKDGAVTATMSD